MQSNFGLELWPVKYIVATPLFHHWHHGSEKEAIDINDAAHLPVLDRLFGLPHAGRPLAGRYGVAGDRLPEGLWRQFLYPFQRKNPAPPAV